MEWHVARVIQTGAATELAELDRSTLADDDWAKEWAGIYFVGAPLATCRTISLAPKAGVAFTTSGCTGSGQCNHGEVAETFPGGIVVRWAKPLGNGPHDYLSEKLYFIRWGEQRFVVPERQLKRMVVYYNAGGSDREQMWQIPARVPDTGPDRSLNHSAPPGRPQLPAEFAALIFERPIHLTLTSVKPSAPTVPSGDGKTSSASGRVELVGGRDRELFVGTRIDCAAKDRSGTIELDRVDDKKSFGTFRVEFRDPSAPPLKAGCVVVLPGAAPEQNAVAEVPAQASRLTDSERKAALALMKEIRTEAATLDRSKLADDDWAKEWAGMYASDDGLAASSDILLAPNAGFEHLSFYCGHVDGVNWGRIVETFPGGIRVTLAKPGDAKPYAFPSTEIYFIRWGDERFAVPKDDLTRMVVLYNAGGMRRKWMDGMYRFYHVRETMAAGHRTRPNPLGRPQLPAPYAAMILEKPLRLKIASARVIDERNEQDDVIGEVELTGGREQGLFVGTEIECNTETRVGDIRLDRVDAQTSHGTFTVEYGEPFQTGDEVLLPGAASEPTPYW
ncbi:MAG TPA: hypothetical protein VMF30_08495 [Pirellulales bacterium]|nr:hypothetical protein [Pirellulales bacterium]